LEIREEINRRISNREGGLRGRIAERRGSRIRVLSIIIYTGAIAISLSLKEAEFVAVSEVWRWRISGWRRRRRRLLDNNRLNLYRSRYRNRYRYRYILLYRLLSTLFLLLHLLPSLKV
jgi:hypothetical protein